jgi:hypothetical protein
MACVLAPFRAGDAGGGGTRLTRRPADAGGGRGNPRPAPDPAARTRHPRGTPAGPAAGARHGRGAATGAPPGLALASGRRRSAGSTTAHRGRSTPGGDGRRPGGHADPRARRARRARPRRRVARLRRPAGIRRSPATHRSAVRGDHRRVDDALGIPLGDPVGALALAAEGRGGARHGHHVGGDHAERAGLRAGPSPGARLGGGSQHRACAAHDLPERPRRRRARGHCSGPRDVKRG